MFKDLYRLSDQKIKIDTNIHDYKNNARQCSNNNGKKGRNKSNYNLDNLSYSISPMKRKRNMNSNSNLNSTNYSSQNNLGLINKPTNAEIARFR